MHVEFENSKGFYLTSFVIPVGTILPLTIDNVMRFVKNASPNLISFTHLEQCLFYIHESDNGINYSNLTFQDAGLFVDYLNANIKNHNQLNTTTNIKVSIYFNIDTSLYGFDKIYGMNHGYSILKGRMQYKKRHRFLSTSLLNNINIQNFVINTYNHFLNKIPTNLESACRSIWFSQSFDNVYKLYNNVNPYQHIKHDTVPDADNVRYGYNLSLNNFVNIYQTTFFVQDSVFVGCNFDFDQTGKQFTFYNSTIMDYEYFNNCSYLKVYKLVDDLTHPNIIAFMVKPVGMDIFRLGYSHLDVNANLCLILKHPTKKVKIVSLDNAAKISNIEHNTSWIVKKNDIVNAFPCSIKRHITRDNFPVIRFAYLLNNGRLSSLSSKIVCKIKQPGTKFMLLTDDL